MKTFVLMMFMASSVFAQTAAIKDIPTEADTTITISKEKVNENEWRITEGSAEIAGEPEVLTKTARTSWKKECDDWKKEIKEMNKDGNQVISITCNSPNCSKNAQSETVCQSTGAYKVKTRIR